MVTVYRTVNSVYFVFNRRGFELMCPDFGSGVPHICDRQMAM